MRTSECYMSGSVDLLFAWRFITIIGHIGQHSIIGPHPGGRCTVSGTIRCVWSEVHFLSSPLALVYFYAETK